MCSNFALDDLPVKRNVVYLAQLKSKQLLNQYSAPKTVPSDQKQLRLALALTKAELGPAQPSLVSLFDAFRTLLGGWVRQIITKDHFSQTESENRIELDNLSICYAARA